ncbi:formate dehydrogenase subunit delta [Tropicimonas sp. S265A]|uniref:formate dehydrogenase subunit delta n=1 Tax=Tropicimonas sp. S265A TaxID=3415134 RepID=UPI003C7D3B92
MSPEKTIRMANQIATFFDSQPQATRVTSVAAHLNDFWDPRMRAQLLEMLEADPSPFHPLVQEAGDKVRAPAA